MKVYSPTGYSYVKVVEIPKTELKGIDFCHCKEPTETLTSFYNRQTIKPDFIINGGLFNMSDGTPCFNFRDEGRAVAYATSYQDGMGTYDGVQLQYGKLLDGNWKDFISGYPPLITNGNMTVFSIAHEIDGNFRRSVLAYNANTVFIIAVEDPGMTFSALQSFLINVINCSYAINLDGGGSTKILQDGISITSASYNRAVDNVIAFYLKSSVAFIYRVQTGAFSNKSNAILLQNQIKALNDTINAGYKNAYIRLINGLYKVQIGAFSQKENALKVVADLKNKGYSSFITTL